MQKRIHLITDIMVTFVSLAVFYPGIFWMAKVFSGMYGLFNLIVLIMILGLIGNKYEWKLPRKMPEIRFRFSWLPAIAVCLSLLLWLYAYYVIHINILAATALGLYVFGLYGLYSAPQKWVKSIVPVTLLLMTLPFGTIMDVYLGFPLRIFIVKALSAAFHDLGMTNITSETIITIENRASQIDLSCSGLKGIWASFIFFFSITWIEKLKISYIWFLSLVLLLTVIMLGNLFRIMAIVSLDSIYDLPMLAEVVHAPLGIISFGFACVLTWFFMKSKLYTWLQSRSGEISFSNSFKEFPLFKPRMNGPLFKIGMILLLIPCAFAFSRKEVKPETERLRIELPTRWQACSMDLRAKEARFFKDQGSSAAKFSFKMDSLQGSLLLVSNTGWRGHHHPEHCFRAAGQQINKSKTVLLSPDKPVKMLEMEENTLGYYWFQSPTSSTDDFSTKVWSEISKQETNWILVSAVFNNINDNTRPVAQNFIHELHTQVNLFLKKNNNHNVLWKAQTDS